MADYVIKIKGLDEILEILDTPVKQEVVEAALTKACLLLEGAAKEKAPKGNGDLRRSIKSEVSNLVGEIYTPLEYAPYVEYGTGLFAEMGGRTDVPWSYQDDKGEWHTTSGMHPMPFMRPALDENREEILRILREGITGNGGL